MKKPVLLILDDDRAVLGALEAELESAFGDICRCELASDPHEALRNVDRWLKDGRQIAAAVVDQRMPGMSGVEFLERCRSMVQEKSPGFQAVVLTGYAGLGVAMDAKNLGGIARFIEKPWVHDHLVEAVGRALRESWTTINALRHVIYRELISAVEIRAHLALRFAVYRRQSNTGQLVAADSESLRAQIDVDAYDAVSRFYGLFAVDADGERLIGTLRVAGDEPGPAAEVVESIAREYPSLLERFRGPRNEPLPMCEYLVDRDAVRDLVKQLHAAGERVTEPGRLTVDPTARAEFAGGGGANLGRHIIESAIGFFFFFFKIENAILTCFSHHVRMYAPLGFGIAEGTTPQWYESFGQEIACLHGRSATVPPTAASRIQLFARRIERTGATCRCATFPACLGTPYETGDFAAVDLFCPLLATEVLRSLRG